MDPFRCTGAALNHSFAHPFSNHAIERLFSFTAGLSPRCNALGYSKHSTELF
jgi:hypothetical protein